MVEEYTLSSQTSEVLVRVDKYEIVFCSFSEVAVPV